jgi:hypothetical protein
MKKVLLSLFAIALISGGLTSCKKCGKCNISGVTGSEICEKDGKDAYNAAKSGCEFLGGSWEE